MLEAAPVTVLEAIRQRITTIELWSNSIIYIKIDAEQEVSLQDSIDLHNYIVSKHDGVNKRLLLVEAGDNSNMTSEARDYSTKEENNAHTLATAVIVKSLAQRIIFNFIINITQKHTMKTKLFDTKEQAISWLLSLRK